MGALFVRTRPRACNSAVFSPIRSFGFDVCLFLLINDESGTVDVARELTAEEVREHGNFRPHTNGTVIRVGQVRLGVVGVDLTPSANAGWIELLATRG